MKIPNIDERPFDSLIASSSARRIKISFVKQPESSIVKNQYISMKLKLLENGQEINIISAKFYGYVANSDNGLLFELQSEGSIFILVRLYQLSAQGPKDLAVIHSDKVSKILDVYDAESADKNDEEENNRPISVTDKNELISFLKINEFNILNEKSEDAEKKVAISSNSNSTNNNVNNVNNEKKSEKASKSRKKEIEGRDFPPYVIVVSVLKSSEISSDKILVSPPIDVFSSYDGSIQWINTTKELMDYFKIISRSKLKKNSKKDIPEKYKEMSIRRIIKDQIAQLKSSELSIEELKKNNEEVVRFLTQISLSNEMQNKQYLNGQILLHYWCLLGYGGDMLSELVQKSEVDSQTINGCTCLHFAAREGNKAATEALIKAKANARIKDYRGQTAIDYASHRGFSEIASLLQAYCMASEDWDESSGVIPLLTATFNGDVKSVDELIKTGVQVDACDPYGATALHVAALYGHIDCMKSLLSASADVNRKDKEGGSALHKASYAGQEECANLLIEGKAEVNGRDNNGATPLHIAAYKNRISLGNILLLAKANPNALDNTGCTPLHQTAGQGHLPFTLHLLEHGADVKITDPNGATALHLACFNGRPACVKVLLEKGTDCNDVKLLHHTAFFGHLECLQEVLSKGKFDINHKDIEGSTPLHKAAFNGHVQVIKYLLSNNANVDIRDEEGAYPLHQAAFNGHTDAIAVLLENGANPKCVDNEKGTPLHNASFNGHIAAVILLMQSGADPNVVDSIGQSPLHLAAQNGHVDCMKALLQKGALDEKDVDGLTALHHACDHVRAVELLLDHGYAIDVQDLEMRTPLHLAVENRREDVVRLLVGRGADLNLKNAKNQTVNEIAEGYMRNVLLSSSKDKENLQDTSIRKLYEEAAIKFNKKPSDGIKFLLQSDLFKTPNDIAKFLHNASGLSKTKLGDLLGENDELSTQILSEFIKEMDFVQLDFDVALRLFLSKFRLPGEAQKIDRIMERFAQRYCGNNPAVFANDDLAYMLAFSLIMLNTDLHNPSIKNKMTKEQFIRNNSNTGLGEDLPEEFLSKMYDSILEREIKMEQEDSLFGNSLVVKSGWMTKQGGRIKTWKKRWFILSDNCVYYFKEKQEEKSKACGIIPLEDMSVRTAKGVGRKYCFELYNPKQEGEIKAMKRVDGTIQKGHHSSYHIAAQDEKQMQEWIEAIKANVFTNPYMQLIMKKKLQKERVPKQDYKEDKSGWLKASSKPSRTSVQIQQEIVGGGGAAPQISVDFTELNVFAGMLRCCYTGPKGVSESYGKFAQVEPPYKKISFFYLINQSFKTQTIAIVGSKWSSSEDLVNDISKSKGNIVEKYQIEQTAKHIRKTGAKCLRKDFVTNIAGHSVGGSVAISLSVLMAKRGFSIGKVVTYGSPKCIPDRSIDLYSAIPVIRVVLPEDPIPTIFPSYKHVGKKVILLNGEQYCETNGEEDEDAITTSISNTSAANAAILGVSSSSTPSLNAGGAIQPASTSVSGSSSSSSNVSSSINPAFYSDDKLKENDIAKYIANMKTKLNGSSKVSYEYYLSTLNK